MFLGLKVQYEHFRNTIEGAFFAEYDSSQGKADYVFYYVSFYVMRVR